MSFEPPHGVGVWCRPESPGREGPRSEVGGPGRGRPLVLLLDWGELWRPYLSLGTPPLVWSQILEVRIWVEVVEGRRTATYAGRRGPTQRRRSLNPVVEPGRTPTTLLTGRGTNGSPVDPGCPCVTRDGDAPTRGDYLTPSRRPGSPRTPAGGTMGDGIRCRPL